MNKEEQKKLWSASIWKWRWLGWRNSTPAFKVSLVLLTGFALYLLTILLGK